MSRWSLLLAVPFAAAALLFAGSADAKVLSACGGIDLSGSVDCQFETSGGCMTQCTPVNVDVSCSAQLEVGCTGMCSGTADVNCNTSCQASCTGKCTPGSFDCEGYCETDCSGHCSAQCSSSGNQTDCMAQCKASCGTRCQGSCMANPPDCMGACQASCNGSCTAQANFMCDISCQESGYASCQSKVSGGCNTQCQQPQGALFCNGQYVDVSPTGLQACVTQIESEFGIKIQASGSASCDGGTCSAQASASASCDMAPQGTPLSGGLLAIGLGSVVAGVVRRRRAKR